MNKTLRKNNTNDKRLSMKNVLINSIRGMLIGIIFTIAAILIFALVVKQANPEDSVISAVNQAIKVLGIGLTAFFATRRVENYVWFNGGFAGMLYIIAGYLIFSAIDGNPGNPLQLLSDILLAVLVGIIFSVIFGQLMKKPKKK